MRGKDCVCLQSGRKSQFWRETASQPQNLPNACLWAQDFFLGLSLPIYTMELMIPYLIGLHPSQPHPPNLKTQCAYLESLTAGVAELGLAGKGYIKHTWPSPGCLIHSEPTRPKEISQRPHGPVPTLFALLPQALTMPSLFCQWTSLSFPPWGCGKRTAMEVATHSEDKLMGSDIILPALLPPHLTP